MAKVLDRAYAEFNRRFFAKALPKIPVRWSEQIDPTHAMQSRRAYAWYTPPFAVSPAGEILIASRLKREPRQWQFSLLHEMCHVAHRDELTIETIKAGADHSPAWQAEMLRLANIGAFRELW